MRHLDGKVALVTGASQGIGSVVARKLASKGAFVAVHGNRSAGAASALVHEIETAGGNAVALLADLSQEDGPEKLIKQLDTVLNERFQDTGLDILINNAGLVKREKIEHVTPEQFDLTLSVNLKAPFFLIQHVLPKLRDYGRIINVSSMSTRSAFPMLAAYAPAKAGLDALTRLLAAQLGPRGITVNSVSPGLTDTGMNSLDTDSTAVQEAIADIALGRIGQPDDIANVIVFLASEEARWVTAQCIEVSGGQRI